MPLRLHNTLTRTKQDFVPIDAKNVRMYVCGPTVYDFAHIGNARPLIVFDVLFRLLRHLYGESHVTYVRNITDVDDKINARAAREYPDLALNDAIRAVTEKTTAQFHADVDALDCLRPTYEPRATEYVERGAASTDMIRLIADLIANKHAYVAEGHVLFDVPSMPDYGKLSNRSLDDMIAGARVEVAPYKKDPMDFVLWKPSKPGEPAWQSPWSNGRPGWHIECSAMAGALLGDTFDIHGGGIDLIFPHHENEIAQSRCAHGTSAMANYWLHNGFLQVEGEKMSKSVGNFVTIRELLSLYPGDVVRLLMLGTHYRQPIDWTREGAENARKELLSWSELVLEYFHEAESLSGINAELDTQLLEALLDDMNSSLAISRLRQMFREIERRNAPIEPFVYALRWLGFKNINRSGFFHPGFDAHLLTSGPQIGKDEIAEIVAYRAATANGMVSTAESLANKLYANGYLVSLNEAGVLSVGNRTSAGMAELQKDFEAKITPLIAARAAARAAKNFAEADRIRAELDAMGIALKDAKDPVTGELVTTWEVKR